MRKSNTRAKATLAKFVAMPFVIVAVGGCAADPADDQVEIIELKVENDQYAALDLDRAGVSLGDMDVYSGNAIKDGRKVGRGGGSCQVLHVDGEKITTQCVLTMELEQGSVTLQALWLKGANPLDMAVTGGTGAYRDARGTVRFWDIATPNERVRAEIIH
ncbi:allene oxide cyclase barrel-like domain-containing protein [Amycolatopsis lurida]